MAMKIMTEAWRLLVLKTIRKKFLRKGLKGGDSFNRSQRGQRG